MFFTSPFIWLALFNLLACLSIISPQQNTVPLMAFKIKHDYPMIPRSEALGKKTVLLKSGNSLTTPLCIRQDGLYTIAGVRYSNDGGYDVITVSIDSENIGSFTSNASTKYGLLWNVFHTSGQIGTAMDLKIGTYTLGLHVNSTDFYGIEIDSILIETTDLTVGEEILNCTLRCVPNYYTEVNIRNSARIPMEIIQRSFKTKCAEQDNIDVPMFHENISNYEVIATYPKYNLSRFNPRDAIFENCETLSPSLLWRLKTEPFDLTQRVKTDLNSFDLDLVNGEPFIININFRLKGKADGLIDSDVGSVLKVDFQNVVNDFNVNCRYITRKGNFSNPTESLVTKDQETFKCAVPDYTWTEHEINTIQLILTSSFDGPIKIKTIELSRRHENGQTKRVIHDDGNTVIKGINVDFWWCRPRTMKVKIRNEIFEEIDFITIYKRIPSTDRFNQVLVIYEDGNFRILPLPPKDIDWTPFGSSMIIGQSEITSFRPVAEISVIEIISIETDTVQLRLHYFDGGSALVVINIADQKTVLRVSQLNFKRSLKEYPFARFRSMWIRDGICDVDHLKVNGGKNIGILAPWNKLNGHVVEFSRLCESLHLNLSPDIALKLLN